MPLDVERIRKDFPILSRTVKGHPLAYLDSASTTQRPRQVLEAERHFYEELNANIHRGIHSLSVLATEAYEEARAKVASFIGAADPWEIVFTRNTTEAINLVARTFGQARIQAGDEILLSELEHHSNLVPWQKLGRERGAILKFIPIDRRGLLNLETLTALLSEKTKLVAITGASNVLGTRIPLGAIARKAREVGATILVDGAQLVPHTKVEVSELGCDFLAFSGHKMLGPTGIGVLWARRSLLEEMEPFMRGGEMVLTVDWLEATWNKVPWKFEAGTPNIAGAIGLSAAVDYLQKIGMGSIETHERKLTSYALKHLRDIPDLICYGPCDPRLQGGIIAFNVGNIHAHDLAQVLDNFGIAIRSGHHCAMPLHKKLGVPATARASFYFYTTTQEIDRLVEGLKQARKIFPITHPSVWAPSAAPSP